MKKIMTFALTALLATTFTQCGNKATQKTEEVERDDTATVVNNNTMVYGICGDASAMNTLELITDTDDTLTLP